MENLSGSTHPEEFSCTTKSGVKADLSEAIFPIIKQDVGSNKFHFLGTGFFIARQGLIMTAKHILQDVTENNIAKGPIGIFHFLPNNQYMIRSFVRGFCKDNSDVGVALLDQPKHVKTNDVLTNKTLPLSSIPCKKGDPVFAYAYPASQIENLDTSQKAVFAPEYFEGILEDEYPTGRDRSMLPNPCWKTSIHVHPGASGGPVLNSKGKVIGINSTSLNIDPSCSFISTIAHMLDRVFPASLYEINFPRWYSMRRQQ